MKDVARVLLSISIYDVYVHTSECHNVIVRQEHKYNKKGI
jgi:hypothetical protein